MPRSISTTSARTPSASRRSSPVAKSPRTKRVRQPASSDSAAKRSSAIGSRSMPISSPSGPRRSAISRAWPAPPTVQSMATSPGRGSSSSSTSSARTGSCSAVMSRSVTKLGGDVVDLVGQAGVVVGPRLAVPDLQAVVGADHDDLLGQAGVLGEERRHVDPARGVELAVDRVGGEEGAELAPLRRQAGKSLGRRGGERLVVGGAPDRHAALGVLREHDALAQDRPELGRDREPVLCIERVVVGAAESQRGAMPKEERAGMEEWEEPLHPGSLSVFYPTSPHNATRSAHKFPRKTT